MKHLKRVSVPKAQFFPEDYPPLSTWLLFLFSFATLKHYG